MMQLGNSKPGNSEATETKEFMEFFMSKGVISWQ